MEKKNGQWNCRECGKMATRKDHMRNHAETHVEGVSKSCNLCGKAFANRASLQQHIYGLHSKLYSCNFCDKSEMTKKNFNQHKQGHHNKDSSEALLPSLSEG